MSFGLKGYAEHAKRKAVSDRDKLVQEHAPMVYRVVRQMSGRLPQSVDREDLFGAGMVGLLEAADNFQVERGIVFEAYARIRVRGAVQDALRRLDHLSRRMRQKSRSIRETHQKMERAAGRPVSDVEVATQMGVAIEDIQTSRTHHTAPDSLDPAVMENVSFTRLWQKELTIVEGLEAQERLEQVVEALSALPERNRLIIGLYYEAELTLKEIGQIVEVTESRVSQIMRKSVSMIREYIEEKNKMG